MENNIKKNTKELENILNGTHIDEINEFLQEHSESFLNDEFPFSTYIRDIIRSKGIKQQDVFLNADIPERYGYKLISGEKRTKQRDIIFRLCYAAQLTLEQTQRALKLYHMPELYSKIPRDALLMITLNTHPGSIFDVNSLLEQHNMAALTACGNID
ncbi:MAG: hypothetical protein IJ053_06615 [Lachnospiraceae bacterium]|nr:hypothetical protein [Lachnospiraceae bacterium]